MLPENESFNSIYFIDHIITRFVQNNNIKTFKKIHKRNNLNLENSKVHISKCSTEKVESARLLHQSAYSPDVSPSNFYLFAYRKEKFKGMIFTGVLL